jgi:hypothetical protein
MRATPAVDIKRRIDMKKILIPVMGIMMFFAGCSTTANIPDESIILPDPNNPFQGKWIEANTKNYMHIIKGYNGSFYYNISGWRRQAVYTIKENENGYVTSNHWRISVSNDILTVESRAYERF